MYDTSGGWGGDIVRTRHHHLNAGQQHQQPHTTQLHSPRYLQSAAFCALLPAVSQSPATRYVTTRVLSGDVHFLSSAVVLSIFHCSYTVFIVLYLHNFPVPI